jgi:hypothetical protein
MRRGAKDGFSSHHIEEDGVAGGKVKQRRFPTKCPPAAKTLSYTDGRVPME